MSTYIIDQALNVGIIVAGSSYVYCRYKGYINGVILAAILAGSVGIGYYLWKLLSYLGTLIVGGSVGGTLAMISRDNNNGGPDGGDDKGPGGNKYLVSNLDDKAIRYLRRRKLKVEQWNPERIQRGDVVALDLDNVDASQVARVADEGLANGADVRGSDDPIISRLNRLTDRRTNLIQELRILNRELGPVINNSESARRRREQILETKRENKEQRDINRRNISDRLNYLEQRLGDIVDDSSIQRVGDRGEPLSVGTRLSRLNERYRDRRRTSGQNAPVLVAPEVVELPYVQGSPILNPLSNVLQQVPVRGPTISVGQPSATLLNRYMQQNAEIIEEQTMIDEAINPLVAPEVVEQTDVQGGNSIREEDFFDQRQLEVIVDMINNRDIIDSDIGINRQTFLGVNTII